tara:strand:+ start:275 stop:457 length:183 start_codon:yes stop_codon:yes gene_type:complete
MLLITQYLLTGAIIAFFLELFIKWTNTKVNMWERFFLIFVWPIMIAIFVWHFLVGLFGND